MKGISLPSSDEIKTAYQKVDPIFSAKSNVSAAELVTWSQWSRADARLGELLVRFLSDHYRKFEPFSLRQENLNSPCPQAICVLLEFVDKRVREQGPSTALYRLFKSWSQILKEDVAKVQPQMFFLPYGFPKPSQDLKTIQRSLALYEQWGFFGREDLAQSKSQSQNQKTLLSAEKRRDLLHELIQKQAQLTVEDYIYFCGGNIQRRTAERDLAAHPFLKKTGHTRGAKYKVKKALPVENL